MLCMAVTKLDNFFFCKFDISNFQRKSSSSIRNFMFSIRQILLKSERRKFKNWFYCKQFFCFNQKWWMFENGRNSGGNSNNLIHVVLCVESGTSLNHITWFKRLANRLLEQVFWFSIIIMKNMNRTGKNGRQKRKLFFLSLKNSIQHT